MGRNPATGEAIKIKASKKVAFRAAKDLKMAVLTALDATHSIFAPSMGIGSDRFGALARNLLS